jgi:hypothetical protein
VAAGITAGAWYAWPSSHAGYELVAAAMLIMAAGHEGKPLDYEALERWTRVGIERGMRFRKGERGMLPARGKTRAPGGVSRGSFRVRLPPRGSGRLDGHLILSSPSLLRGLGYRHTAS